MRPAGKAPQYRAAHVAIDALVERRVCLKVTLNAGEFVEEIDTQSDAFPLVVPENVDDLGCGCGLVFDARRHALTGVQLSADIVQGDARLIWMGAMMGQPRPQFIHLGVAQRRGGCIVQNAVEKAIGQLEPFSRIELLQLVEENCLVHERKVLFGPGISILASPQH